MSSNGATERDDGDDSGRSYSTEPNPNKRPPGRKQAKERLKIGGDAGLYKEAIAELILDKKEEKKPAPAPAPAAVAAAAEYYSQLYYHHYPPPHLAGAVHDHRAVGYGGYSRADTCSIM